MKPLALILCLALICGGCQQRALPTIPMSPDMAASLKVIADSNLDATQKEKAMSEYLASTERMYTATLSRAQDSGKNIVSIILSIFGVVGTFVTTYYAVTK